MMACRNGHKDLARLLIAKGANIDNKDNVSNILTNRIS
jgi:ankyrin repeat protein